jgi:hypothetical protein
VVGSPALVSSSRTSLFRVAILGLIATLTLAGGCGSRSPRDTVLRFWAMGREVVAEVTYSELMQGRLR